MSWMVARDGLFLCMWERTMPRRRERRPSLVSTGVWSRHLKNWTVCVVGVIKSNGRQSSRVGLTFVGRDDFFHERWASSDH